MSVESKEYNNFSLLQMLGLPPAQMKLSGGGKLVPIKSNQKSGSSTPPREGTQQTHKTTPNTKTSKRADQQTCK